MATENRDFSLAAGSKSRSKPNVSKTLQHFTQGGDPSGTEHTDMPYLLKTEPDKYSFADLQRDGETIWDGISNNTALLNLRNMKKGENLVIYHSNVGKAAVGIAKVVSVDATDPKNPKVVIKPVKPLKHEKTLAEMREASVFKDSILFRQFRLSVVPLTEAQYDWLTS
jgi:predicted RNA-binding protein with PUA-like domain